ncbi:MAG: hypothetical protein C5B47_01010, partial [Verrucomicrobia bacterium]
MARATVATICGIPAIFLIFYGVYGGSPSEYLLVAGLSDDNPGWSGFLYPWEEFRKYLSVFFHIGYWIPKLFGQTGSWIGYHIIFCTLLAVRGALV